MINKLTIYLSICLFIVTQGLLLFFCLQVEKLQQQLKWRDFPGVHALLLKGCTSANTYEATITLLSRFTPLTDLQVRAGMWQGVERCRSERDGGDWCAQNF